MRPRVLLVSYHAANVLTPRGARTHAVARALARHADVTVIGAAPRRERRTWLHRIRDRALSEAGSRWLIDPFEPWSLRVLGRRRFDADVAVLLGYPFSPLAVAAKRLRAQGIPYVVDMSDPWARVLRDGRPTLRDRRAAVLERRLWIGAAAGIVTTAAQAEDVREVAPSLELLVRPNGYADIDGARAPRERSDGEVLRLGHFGSLYAQRADPTHFMRVLGQSGLWREVILEQYGSDAQRVLRKIAPWVTVRIHDPVPWPEIVDRVRSELDAALVIGNRDPRQLPSKAVEYLTLPVPRVALSRGEEEADALARYVTGKPGWLVVAMDDPDPAAAVREHVSRPWNAEDLAPPRAEAWGPVAEEIAEFILRSRRRCETPGRPEPRAAA